MALPDLTGIAFFLFVVIFPYLNHYIIATQSMNKKLKALSLIIQHPRAFTRLCKGMLIWFSDSELLRLANGVQTDKGYFGH